jgi:serine/threonine-protein kinase RsbW
MSVTTYTFPGRYACLADIAGIVKEKSAEAGLKADFTYAVESAVDEACSNIIEHAYEGENKGEIVLEFEIIDQGIKVRITDHGNPFDPDKVAPPNTSAPLSKRKPSGLGLYLMKKCMDEVNFQFSPGCNTLTMVKYRDSG